MHYEVAFGTSHRAASVKGAPVPRRWLAPIVDVRQLSAQDNNAVLPASRWHKEVLCAGQTRSGARKQFYRQTQGFGGRKFNRYLKRWGKNILLGGDLTPDLEIDVVSITIYLHLGTAFQGKGPVVHPLWRAHLHFLS
jgi:hypothetical protein